ncbi:hypothetical protein LEMLEM_LOCUS20728 [Lemmus lemmus]
MVVWTPKMGNAPDLVSSCSDKDLAVTFSHTKTKLPLPKGSSTIVLCPRLVDTASSAAVHVSASICLKDPDGSSDLEPRQSEISILECLSIHTPP